ncbi:MAG: hypothetical protein ACYTF1_13615 [Planctomycetota bacterium]
MSARFRTIVTALSFVIISHSSAYGAAFFQGLGDLPGGEFSSVAYAISDDGSTVVGMSVSTNGHTAYRWTKDSGMIGLGDLPEWGPARYAHGVSADGSVVVGVGITKVWQWTFLLMDQLSWASVIHIQVSRPFTGQPKPAWLV